MGIVTLILLSIAELITILGLFYYDVLPEIVMDAFRLFYKNDHKNLKYY